MVIMTADATTTIIAPEAYLANKVFQSVARLEGIKAAHNSYRLYKRVDGSDSSALKEKVKMGVAGAGADSLNAFFDWRKNLDEIDVKEETEKNKRLQDYTSQGQWYLKKGGNTIDHDSTIYRDFNAGLRQRELDENGLTGFMESSYSDYKGGKADIKQSIDVKIDDFNKNTKEEDKKISDEVRKYVKGEGSLTLDKMTSKQLNQFESVLGELENEGASHFSKCLDEKFGE